MRFTFSKNLAQFLCSYDSTYYYKKLRFSIKEYTDKQENDYVYAIVSYTGAVLRMATTYDRAKILCDDNYRFVFKAKIKVK